MLVGSSNGRLGIIEYNLYRRTSRVPTVIVGNTLDGVPVDFPLTRDRPYSN